MNMLELKKIEYEFKMGMIPRETVQVLLGIIPSYPAMFCLLGRI